MFAHINSPQTIANLGANPAIETPSSTRSCGAATGSAAGAACTTRASCRARTGGPDRHGYDANPDRIRAVVLIEVEEALELLSPAYDDDSSTAQVAAPWRERMRRRLMDA